MIKNEIKEEQTDVNKIEELSPVEIEEAKEKTETAHLSKAKLFFNMLSIWSVIKKAKKINKKIKNDPNFYTEEWRYNWVKKKCRKVLKLTNVYIDVVGIENWLDRGIVLAPNHQSNLDPILMFSVNDFLIQQPVAFIAKKELWTQKIFKNFMNLTDNVPIDRNNPRSALTAVKEAKELISEYKRSLVIFPEGTRSAKQEIGEFQSASMKVAQMAYVPIVPVTIIDSYKLFIKRPKGKFRIKIIFGKPLMPEKFISLKTEMLTKNVQREVQKNMDLYKDWDPKKLNITPKKIDKKSRVVFY
ncbi:lysophospholipid acyltransferase family protein [Spiroplasma taiwanense]|uniref:1-acyl-sn-glycerol-3-phosphate acyltransferase n=1 Tax=Spiroplasma taiwanense CT-1 TaxID=1276220 RepID=S5MCH9_9MOLU|nr:lysophospholipid acyltransferase family protein [Spiroplasma taiwanense]AGR41433.1 1-acyl-sn-glycerol-3-phosphate acyltransferase [Spiroplasma taiwanense CT-1]